MRHEFWETYNKTKLYGTFFVLYLNLLYKLQCKVYYKMYMEMIKEILQFGPAFKIYKFSKWVDIKSICLKLHLSLAPINW
jgi:hypothetical protein